VSLGVLHIRDYPLRKALAVQKVLRVGRLWDWYLVATPRWVESPLLCSSSRYRLQDVCISPRRLVAGCVARTMPIPLASSRSVSSRSTIVVGNSIWDRIVLEWLVVTEKDWAWVTTRRLLRSSTIATRPRRLSAGWLKA
jgi:hypothetical protein